MKNAIVVFVLMHLTTLALSDEFQEFTHGNNIFTANLCKEIAATTSENFILSPFSAEVILALTQSGAKDETANEIRRSLHLPNDQNKIEKAVSSLLHSLKRERPLTLHTANKIYVKNDFPVQKNFKKIAENVFQTGTENINFELKNQAAGVMNRWVEEQTNNKIHDLVDSQSLNYRTKAVLINALYFQGNWTNRFKPYITRKLKFHRSSDDVINVDTMQTRADFNYYENPELEAKFLEMPFEDEDISMVIVLPNKIDGLAALENNAKAFLPQKFVSETVNLALPKFKIQTRLNLKKALMNMGVRRIFDQDQADLTGIAGEKGDLVVDQVVQKSFIDVNEEGVEAAAASYVDLVVPLSGYFPLTPPKNFTVDHPFLFYIKAKDLILFAGRVTTPTY